MEELPSSDKDHADADWLKRDEAETPQPPPPQQIPVAPDEAYEIEGGEPGGDVDETAAPIVPPVPEPAPRQARPRAADKPAAGSEAATVDVVWTRWGEWGPDVVRLGLAALVTLFLLYLTVSSLYFLLAFLVLVVGAAVMAVLFYPLAITFERPVRVTPEQAVKDYYGALSHSVPHYRRMWLLLSSAGRSCPEYVTFEAFESYWRNRLTALDDGVSKRFNPLRFEVEDFRSEKSKGQTAIDGTFTLNVRHRRRPDQTVRSFRIALGLVKGPDRMWYLNRGTLPKA